MEDKFVSVIIPIYNEEKYIDNCINSLINQTYPRDKMEWILVDGNSNDKTIDIINSYIERGYPIKLLENKERKTPISLNIGIKNAKGDYIIRLDAHSYFYEDYIEKCVYYLNTTDAANVGGIAETNASTFIGKSIAQMLSTKFGVGDSDFRTGNGNRYVDTVPFGAFRKEIFDKVGLFNPELLRSEDNDMNARIRESGGKIYLAEDIRFKYFCRDTISGILKMALLNGNGIAFTLWTNRKAVGLRHLIPFAFLMSLIILPILMLYVPYINYLFYVEMGLYFLLDLYFSFFSSKPQYGLINIWLFPLFHITYGLGTLLGLFRIKLY